MSFTLSVNRSHSPFTWMLWMVWPVCLKWLATGLSLRCLMSANLVLLRYESLWVMFQYITTASYMCLVFTGGLNVLCAYFHDRGKWLWSQMVVVLLWCLFSADQFLVVSFSLIYFQRKSILSLSSWHNCHGWLGSKNLLSVLCCVGWILHKCFGPYSLSH